MNNVINEINERSIVAYYFIMNGWTQAFFFITDINFTM